MLSTLLTFALLSSASIQLDRDANGTQVVRVVGGGAGKVALYVVDPANADLPAMLGTAVKLGDDLLFTPRFPFQPGREYRIEFVDTVKLTKSIRIPNAPNVATSTVLNVYPSVDSLPANQLKLYVQFSAPMSRGVAYDHIQLLDDTGKKVEHAFLELGEELWDSNQMRFTLLFDPGRIKRDLVPNVDDGTPLQPGHRYTLRIDATWPDSHGRPLQKAWTKNFAVTAADRTAPDPKAWLLQTPTAATRAAVCVNTQEPMDFGLLLRTLRINAGGTEIKGTVAVEDGEKSWCFTPAQPWTAGNYQLQIDGSLEDLAGNRIGRLFEVDTRTSPDMANRPSGKSTSLSFAIIPRNAE